MPINYTDQKYKCKTFVVAPIVYGMNSKMGQMVVAPDTDWLSDPLTPSIKQY